MKRRVLGAVLWIAALPASATQPVTGDVLAEVSVDECGELTLDGSEIGYRSWRAGGEPQLIHFMAARPSLVDDNAPVLRSALRDRPEMLPYAMTVLDVDDAIWGMRSLAKAGMEYNKRKHPRARMVADCAGALAERWQLPARSSALILLDAGRRVRFVRIGPTSEEERLRLLAEIDALVLPGRDADVDAGTR